MDENQLYGAGLDRVYRLALLATGSPRAATRLLRRAFARRDSAVTLDETALAAALLLARPGPWLWRPDPAALAYSGLAPADLAVLRAQLAAASPAARLALGAGHVAGIELQLQAPPPAAPAAPWPRRATDRHALLALLARAWGLLPAQVAYADVYEQALSLAGALAPEQADELRSLLLANSPAAEQSRAVREGLRRAEARLAAALPALFGGEAPAALRAELAQLAQPRRRRAPLPQARRLQLALVAAVALVAVAVIALPQGAPRPAPRPAGAAAEAPSEPAGADALVRAALTRLDSLAGGGVRHERFAAEATGYGWTLERWQELGPPHRFRVEVRDEQDQLRYALASDGEGLVQQRHSPGREGDLEGGDYRLDPATLAALLPTLRQQPDSLFMLGSANPGFNLERYYLNQALDAPLRDMGATMAAGRPAQLLAFESEAPLPPQPDTFEPPEARPAQVLLAIDNETRALLEARVLPPEGAEAGEVRRPWRVERLELLASLPDARFRLPPLAGGASSTGELLSARLFGEAQGSLRELSATELPADGGPLYFPADGAGVGYSFSYGGGWTMLVRETAEEVLQLIPFSAETAGFVEGARSTRRAGERDYDLIYPPEMPPGRNVSLATIFLSADRARGMHVIYSHAYASQAEREARLDALIRSLAPLELGG